MSIQATPINVRPVCAFSDNYIWLIDSPQAPGRNVAVDPGDAAPVIAELQRSGTSLAAILLTHHHPDHIGGVPELLRRWAVPVIGPDDSRIAQRTLTVHEGGRCGFPGLGTFLRDFGGAWAYFKPHCPLGAWCAVLRRHAVQRRLRANVRGYADTNERFVEQAARAAARHPSVLRPRIHGGQPALRIDGGSGQQGGTGIPG